MYQEEAASWHALTTGLCLGFEDQAEQKSGFSTHKTTEIRLDSGQLKNEQTKNQCAIYSKPLEEALVQPLWGTIWHYFVELKYVFYDTEIHFLGLESALKFPHNVPKQTCLSMFTEAL